MQTSGSKWYDCEGATYATEMVVILRFCDNDV